MTEETIRDTMAAEFDKLQEPEEIEADIARDERGRFKTKQESEEIPAVEEPVVDVPAEEITDQGTETASEPTAAIPPLEAPIKWSAELKAKFAALPRETQQLLLEREGEYDKGFTQKSQEAADYKKRYEPLEPILETRKQQFAMQGMTVEQGLTQLFALSDMAAKTPREFAKMFLSNHGIDPASLVQQPGTEVAPDPLTPVLNEVNSLKQLIQNREQADTDRAINSFKAAPNHEHFDEVRREMGVLMQHGLATDMEDAYQRACRANPVVWERMRQLETAKAESDRKAAEAKRIEQADLAAKNAKKAQGTTVATKPAVGSGRTATLTTRETMSKAYDELQGAA